MEGLLFQWTFSLHGTFIVMHTINIDASVHMQSKSDAEEVGQS